MTQCPKCQYIHAPEKDSLTKFLQNLPVKWIGDEVFDLLSFYGHLGHQVYALRCPKCKAIFIQTETGYFEFHQDKKETKNDSN